jgi:hypothetical protein
MMLGIAERGTFRDIAAVMSVLERMYCTWCRDAPAAQISDSHMLSWSVVAARLLSIWLRGDAVEFEIGECEVLE